MSVEPQNQGGNQVTSDSDWKIRQFIYQALVRGESAPSPAAIAARFQMSSDEAQQALLHLHDAHALTLDGEGRLMMAHPLSAIETDYKVFVDERPLYANCAWDSLGIPAMLGSDAHIDARHPLTGEIIQYAVADGELQADDSLFVHFALPFRHWYADIVDT